MATTLNLVASFDFTDPGSTSPSVTPDRGLQGDGITYNATTGTLFVARTDDPDGQTGPQPRVQSVLQFNTDGTYINEFAFSAAQVPAGITTLPNGNLLIASPNPIAGGAFDGKIIEVTTTGTVVAGGINFDLPDAFNSREQRGLVVGVAYSPAYATNNRFRSKDASILVITSRSQEIVEFDLAGNIIASLDLSKYGVTAPQGLAINPANGNIFVTDEAATSGGTNKIYEISPLRDELAVSARNTQLPRFGSLVSVIDTQAAFGLTDPEDVTFGSDGKLYAVFDGDDAAGSNRVASFSVQTPTGLPTLRTLDKFTVAGVASSFALTEFTTQAAQDFAPTVPVFTSTTGSLASITVFSLPEFGSLTLNGAAVTLGQTIAAANLANLVYTANISYSGVDTFQVTASNGTASSAIAHIDLFVNAPTASKLTATDVFSIDLGNANDDRFNNSADGITFNPTNGKVYTSSSFRINPTDPNTIGWRLIESNTDGSSPRVILQSEAVAVNVAGQTPFVPLPNVPVLDLVPNDPTDGVQDLGVVQGTGTARDGNLLILSTRGASIFEVTPNGVAVNGGINIHAPGLFESGAAFDRSAVGLLHTVENGQEYIYVTDFGERLIRKVPAVKGTATNPATLTQSQVISEIKLQSAIPESRLQALTLDVVTGNFFVADDASGNAAIYEIKPDGTIVGSTDMLALGRELGIQQGLTGEALTAFTDKFADLEGITIDPATRTLYAAIDDDGVGQFGLANIGRQVVAISINQLFAQDTYEVTIEDNAEDGDNVGEPITATDPDTGETIVYSITGGNLDPDQDGKAAFIIDTSAGQLKINDADDLELVDVFNLTITATDPKGLKDTTAVEVSVSSFEETATNGIFTIGSEDVRNLIITAANNLDVNIGIFFTDDAQGRIDGLSPGATGYEEAATGRAVSLLSAIADSNGNLSPGQLKKVLGLQNAASLVGADSGTYLYFGFLAVSDVSVGELFANGATDLNVTLSTDNGVNVQTPSDGSGEFSITLNNLAFTLSFTNEDEDDFSGLLGIDLDNDSDDSNDEIVDEVIANITTPGTYTVSGSIFREAAYNNTVGFFRVNGNGQVLNDNGDLVQGATPDSLTNYKAAIVSNLISGAQYQVANNSTANFSFTLNLTATAVVNDFFVLPVLAVQGNFSNAVDYYYPIIAANADEVDHIKFQGAGATGNGRFFGFEDLQSNISDNDFDDFIIQVQVAQVV